MSTTFRQDRLLSALHDRSRQLGFDAMAITHPGAIPEAPERLAAFLEAGYHASMTWMEETAGRRANPALLWPDVRSIIILAMNYGPAEDPLSHLQTPSKAGISVYARNRDYHDLIKGKLKELAGFIVSRSEVGADVKVFVDTAPVMEKPLAHAAGLGWQGKHSNLVSKELGSWFFLGAIFTTLELPANTPQRDHCGSCRACLDSCPTNAFPSPYQLDARKCISYLTIEHKGPIPHEFRIPMGNRIYGCDDCLAACPWNKFAQETHQTKLKARPELIDPDLADLLTLDDTAFRKLFSGSPIKRIGRNRFIRNVLIAAGNSSNPALLPLVTDLLSDPDTMVRDAAIWATARLTSEQDFTVLRNKHLPLETEPSLQAEWQAGKHL